MTSPVVVEEDNTLHARDDGCGNEVLQPCKEREEFRQGELSAKAEGHFIAEPVFDLGTTGEDGPLPTKEHLLEFAAIAHGFNYPPDAQIPERNHAHIQRAKTGFTKTIEAALKKAERAFVLEALDYALAITGLKEHDPQHNRGPAPALSYFNKAFTGQLHEIRQREHDARVNAKTVEEKALIGVNAVKEQAAIRVNGTKARTAAWNQAAAKQIESAPKNGQSAPMPAAERFDERKDKIIDVRSTWISGMAANTVLDDVPGSTKEMVYKGLQKAASGLDKENIARCSGQVEKPSEDRVLRWVRKYCIFEIHGKPAERCGGPIAELSGRLADSHWVCLSQQFIDGMKAKHPLPESSLFSVFESLMPSRAADFAVADYLSLQAKFETEFEAKAAEAFKAAEELRRYEERDQERKQQQQEQQQEESPAQGRRSLVYRRWAHRNGVELQT